MIFNKSVLLTDFLNLKFKLTHSFQFQCVYMGRMYVCIYIYIHMSDCACRVILQWRGEASEVMF
jgi:hypothetical protein